MALVIFAVLFIWILAAAAAIFFILGAAPAGKEMEWLDDAAKNIQWPIGYRPQ